MIRKAGAAESKLLAGATTALRTILRLKRILGWPRAETEPKKRIVLGHGRTAASTRFEVSTGSSLLVGPGPCHRWATVAYSRPRVHAKGPLVYGGFSALPSELTVLGENGATVYTENLQVKTAEAAQFCEGYAEP